MIQTGLIKLGGSSIQLSCEDTPELLADRLVPVVQLGLAVPEERN